MARRRNYTFKWWHGVLGLLGLSVVAGTVKAVAGENRRREEGPYTFVERGLTVEIAPQYGNSWTTNWKYTVSAPALGGLVLQSGFASTSHEAERVAREFVASLDDDQVPEVAGDTTRNPAWLQQQAALDPAHRRTLAGARGTPARLTAARTTMQSPAYNDQHSWQTRWERFRR